MQSLTKLNRKCAAKQKQISKGLSACVPGSSIKTIARRAAEGGTCGLSTRDHPYKHRSLI